MITNFTKLIVLILLFSILFGFVYFESWVVLFESWSQFDKGYSHGFLVFGISVYLVFRVFQALDADLIKPSYWVAPLLLLTSCLWVMALYADIRILHLILIPVLILLSISIWFGFKITKRFLFPVFFLYFAIPIWDVLTETLQNITVYINSIALSFSGIPAYIDGLYVTIPQGTFEIAGGCSGSRYLLVMLTLTALYSYQNYSTWKSKVIFVSIGVLLGLFTNWLRVFIIILFGYFTDMQSSLIKDHEIFGWYLFAAILVPLFYMAIKLHSWMDEPNPAAAEIKTGRLTAVNISPFIISFFFAFSAPLVLKIGNDDIQNVVYSPKFIGSAAQDELMINPQYVGADINSDNIITTLNGKVQVSTRTYEYQEQGKELIGYYNRNFSNEWRVDESFDEAGFLFQRIMNRKSGKNLLVAHQYSIGGYHTIDKFQGKLFELVKPFLNDSNSSVTIFVSECGTSCDLAKSRLIATINKNMF